MKNRLLAPLLCLLIALAATGHAATFTGTPFYGDAPDATHPWAIHDRNRPQPPRVEPGTFSTPAQPGKPPSDAIVLFDGTAASLAKWEADTKPGEPGAPTKWIVNAGALECVPKSGYIRSKEQFGDCQLHVEWAAPKKVQGDSQGRGNSGIFLMNNYEIQVLDSYDNKTYFHGQAGSIYKQHKPLANPMRKPGEWNVYDIVFTAPVFDEDGKVLERATFTAFLNGVLVQNAVEVMGVTAHDKPPYYEKHDPKMPISLQDHGDLVRFRNIWVRNLE